MQQWPDFEWWNDDDDLLPPLLSVSNHSKLITYNYAAPYKLAGKLDKDDHLSQSFYITISLLVWHQD